MDWSQIVWRTCDLFAKQLLRPWILVSLRIDNIELLSLLLKDATIMHSVPYLLFFLLSLVIVPHSILIVNHISQLVSLLGQKILLVKLFNYFRNLFAVPLNISFPIDIRRWQFLLFSMRLYHFLLFHLTLVWLLKLGIVVSTIYRIVDSQLLWLI